MADFGIRFFLCNIFICAIICLFLIAKHLLRRTLTSRMQFHLWFLLLGLLAVPFIPVRPARFSQVFLMLDKWKNAISPGMEAAAETAVTVNMSGATGQINDFALSVSDGIPPMIGLMLFGIWLIGLLVMLLFVIKSKARLNTLKKSALPLQNREVRMIYNSCLSELKIKKDIPIYSTAFLKSPIMTGLFRPRIDLPIHLISDFLMSAETHTASSEKGGHVHAEGHKGIPAARFTAADMRYMLLHELQHYKHKDAIASCLMNLLAYCTGLIHLCGMR